MNRADARPKTVYKHAMSLRSMSISSLILSASSLYRVLAQFFILPVLARYLSPEDYGLIALAMPFVLISEIFARSGIGEALLREKTRDETTWSAAFWYILSLGSAFCLGIILIAPFMARLFDTPGLTPILMGIAPYVLIQTISIIPLTYMRHDHKFAAVAKIQTFSVTLGLICALFLATSGAGAWTLVIQQLVLNGATATIAFWRSGFRPRFIYDISRIKNFLSFGRRVAAYNLVDFLRDASRAFIIGKILSTALLGYYSLAYLFFNLPYRIFNMAFSDVIFVNLSKHRENKALHLNIFFLVTRALSSILFPVIGLMAAAHTPVFAFLLSEKWAPSGQLFMIAAPVMALHTVLNIRTPLMLTYGRADINLRCNLELITLETIALLIGTLFWGLQGAVAGLATAILFYQPRNIFILKQYAHIPLTELLKTLLIPAAAALIGVAIYTKLQNSISGELTLITIAAGLALAATLAALAIQYKPLKENIRRASTTLSAP